MLPDTHATASGSRIESAKYAIRVHCPISWPEGQRCLNCQRMFPCPTFECGFEVLTAAGWTEDDIARLDTRTGPWS